MDLQYDDMSSSLSLYSEKTPAILLPAPHMTWYIYHFNPLHFCVRATKVHISAEILRGPLVSLTMFLLWIVIVKNEWRVAYILDVFVTLVRRVNGNVFHCHWWHGSGNFLSQVRHKQVSDIIWTIDMVFVRCTTLKFDFSVTDTDSILTLHVRYRLVSDIIWAID